MGSAPSPPPTPDPYKTASAQQVANVEVAKTNTWLSNADEDSPSGSIRYTDSGKTQDIYTYDSNGAIVGTQTVQKPKRTITLTTKGQLAWDKHEDLTLALNTWALTQVGIFQSQPAVGTTGLTARLTAPAAATISTTGITAGTLVETIGATDLTAHMGATRDAIDSRLQYQIGVDRDLRIAALALQCIFPGSVAYARDMLAFDKQSTDARIEAYLAAQKEQSRIIQTEGLIAEFKNRVTQMKFTFDQAVKAWANSTEMMKFQALSQAAEYVNALRERELQEQIAVSAANINMMSTLIHGGTVQTPQFQNFRAGEVAKTPVAESVYQSAAMDMQKWQAQVQQQQSLFGGLLGLGGNLLGGMMMMSDGRLKADFEFVGTDSRGIRWHLWRYLWDAPGVRRFGVIAQELAEVMPYAVVQLPSGWLAVNYGALA